MKEIARGAEAVLYFDSGRLVKDRIKKNYRIDEIDCKLRRDRTKKEFRLLLKKLLKKIEIVSLERIIAQCEKAMEIAKNIDEKDAIFFACALAHSGSIIWSDDKALKNQKEIPVYNTQEISDLIRIDDF